MTLLKGEVDEQKVNTALIALNKRLEEINNSLSALLKETKASIEDLDTRVTVLEQE